MPLPEAEGPIFRAVRPRVGLAACLRVCCARFLSRGAAVPLDYAGDLLSPWAACGPQLPTPLPTNTLILSTLLPVHSNSNHVQSACYYPAPPRFWEKHRAGSHQSCSPSAREKHNALQIRTLMYDKCCDRGMTACHGRHEDMTGTARNNFFLGGCDKASEK